MRATKKILYGYDFMTELCIHQGEVVPNRGMSAAQGKVQGNTGIVSCLTFRHRAFPILGQAFHYSPENAFYIFNRQIYFII